MMLSILSMQSEQKVIESARAGRLVVMMNGDISQKKPEWSATLKATGADGMEDYYTAEGGIVTVNTETAEALNIDTAVFKDFGDIVEVTTTED